MNPPSSLSPPNPIMYPPFYDQHSQQPSPYLGRAADLDSPATIKFKGLSGPLPTDVAIELNGVLSSLTGTKESIKGAKTWFMQRSPFAPALAEALRDRISSLDDSEKQLHIIFLANDILFDSLQRRVNPRELDNEALAFKPVLGSMLARVYYNPQNNDANQSRLEKIVQFWASKEVYDQETIRAFEIEMTGGVLSYRSRTPDVVGPMDSTDVTGAQQHLTSQWQSEKQKHSGSADLELPEKLGAPAASSLTQFSSSASQQMLEPVRPAGTYGQASSTAFPGSLPMQTSLQSATPQVPPASTAGAGEQARPPPYPLFPPGLIPGMVRKMQIGSGVPYSPMSPLDIPTVIPTSTASPSEILERVSRFFKEIGEVNPSEGPMKPSDSINVHDDYEQDEYEREAAREAAVRKGGACIPPPPSLQQVDMETGMYPDGSVERKPGSNSSGRLGLGATADPNEMSQYDDVYTSYRKQRSTNYHTSMSARSSAR